MNNYIEKFAVKNYEIDHNGFFKPFAFLNHAQEMANIHALSLGFGYDNLISSGVVWVLSRIHIKFNRLPLWKEKLSMETWHKGSDRLFGYRDYSVVDNKGVEVIAATSSWLIIDHETRKLQRIDHVLGDEFKGTLNKNAIEEAPGKIIMPSQMRHCGNKVVSISDIDINHHTNNARYLEWALDAIDPQISTKAQIKELWLNFNNESLLGENIELHCCEQLSQNLSIQDSPTQASSSQDSSSQGLSSQDLSSQDSSSQGLSSHDSSSLSLSSQDSSLEIYIEGKRDGKSIFQTKIVT